MSYSDDYVINISKIKMCPSSFINLHALAGMQNKNLLVLLSSKTQTHDCTLCIFEIDLKIDFILSLEYFIDLVWLI